MVPPTHPDGLNLSYLSERRVTFSTLGLMPANDRLADSFEGGIALAIFDERVRTGPWEVGCPENGQLALCSWLRRLPPKREKAS